MKKLIIPVLLLAFSLAAGEVKIDLSAVRPGGQAPKLVSDAAGNALEFTASGNSVTAAGIPQTFDFRQGGKIEFEFQDAEKQSNPFPRLLETGSVSLQFEAAPNAPGGDKILKVLLTDFNTKGIAQIKIPCPHKTGVWHKAVFEIDPSAKAFSLTLDGKQHRAPLSVSPRLENLQFILGASTLNNSPRGFSGRIRNIRIVTPHSMPAGGESAIMNQKVSPGVRHVRICAIKGRHYAFPGITRLPDGDLAAVFREGAGHVCPYGRICIAYSKEYGIG